MAALTETPKATYIRPNAPSDQPTREIPHSFHAEVSKKLEDLKNSDSVDVMRALDTADGPVATSTGKHSRASRPTSGREHRRSRRGSTVTDADGNIVEAFGFLDGYSDGEGTDYHDSGQSTPTPARDNDINL
ncbi:hypothetical protein DPMN_027021 [Dreissena polymorpha]|uniref:Uncharacterized protein n=1 Tax=Dreissena polymorpha TaxID=45954 RepID=A0A9D4LTL7_DREPO|nr:hypothetical protein DPMN_027021 [Dreissena polymorpha]